MKNPRISVIMPVYNSEKYIKKTIDSILNQTLGDFELIIIDDCGTDTSMKIVEEISDKRIRIIRNETNQGIAYSRNVGIENAKGDFIALMDNDDLCPLFRFEKEVEYLDTHPEIGVVGGNVVTIDENDAEISSPANMVNDPEMIWGEILFFCPMANSSALIRKKVIDDVKLRYEDNKFGMEDYNFWMDISTHTKIYNFDDVLLKWRSTGNAETSRTRTKNAKSRARVFAEIQKKGLASRGIVLSKTEQILFCNVFSEYKDCTSFDLKQLYSLLRKILTQTKEKWPEYYPAMQIVLRNRYLEAAKRKGVRYSDALYCGGFGGLMKQKDLPLVSVIIPTHNRAEKLGMSVASVLNQTYYNLEVIVVDDCSTDNTEETIQNIMSHNSNLRYCKMKKNGGPAVARNEGVKIANGTFVAFHDDDDEWHPDKLEIQMGLMIRDCTIDMSFSQMARYKNMCYLNTVNEMLKWSSVKDTFLKELLLDNYVGAPTIVMKKDSFDMIGGFNTSLSSIEDWEFAIRAAINLNIEFISSPLMDVHVHDNSVTYNGMNYADSWLYIIKKYNSYAKDFRSLFLKQMFAHLLGNTTNRISEEQAILLRGRIKSELVPKVIKEELLVDMLLRSPSSQLISSDYSGSNISRLQRYKNVSKKLMLTDNSISTWLLNMGYKRVAIYGIGVLGKCLIDRLNDTEIEICCMMDRSQRSYNGVSIITSEEFIAKKMDCDVVIVTPLYEAEAIGRAITQESGMRCISIENLLEG